MSEGSEDCGGIARGLGRGAGRGTGEASTGVRSGLGVVAGGVGVFTGSAFSIRFSFGVGDFSASEFFFFAGVAVALVFVFGVTSSSSSPDFLPGVFDALGFGVGDSSSSSSPAGVFFAFAFGLGVGVGVAFFFDFDFRVAGFGVAVGSGVSDGLGEATARISSRAFFFFSSVDCARTKTPRRATTEKIVPRITRSRITGRERNRGDCAIKRAVAPPRARARTAPVRAAKSHSVFRRGAKAGK